MRLLWDGLQDATGAKYREAVARGWTSAGAVDEFKLYVSSPPKSPGEVEEYHFRTAAARDSLTEHQALTAVLRFWTRIQTLIDNERVEEGLVRDLFKDEFNYERAFFLQRPEIRLETRRFLGRRPEFLAVCRVVVFLALSSDVEEGLRAPKITWWSAHWQ